MAHILVQSQQAHRTPNMTIHRPSNRMETSLTMTHSVDDRLFLCKHDPARLLNLIHRFASEPQISMYHGHSTAPTDQFSSLSIKTIPETHRTLEDDEIQLEEIFQLNCDITPPILTETMDEIVPEIVEQSVTSPTIPSEMPHLPIEDDILLDPNAPSNGNDTSGERHFRRRKRRSSLTRSSLTLDEPPIISDSNIKSIDSEPPAQSSSEPTEQSISNQVEKETQPSVPTVEKAPEDATTNEEGSAAVSRYRGKRLRHRFYRHVSGAGSLDETIHDPPVRFFLSNDSLNGDTNHIVNDSLSSPTLTPPPFLSPGCSTPPLKASSSPAVLCNTKEESSTGKTRKSVRFADTVGLALTQVQYIQSSRNDDSSSFSSVISTSFLSSSPPSFNKGYLLPNQSNLEHKPWSFDVAFIPKYIPNEKSLSRRFFCLYRQPNSEHPDIYLHEIWRKQIKLEHADIPSIHSDTGEQYLVGTVWVTNAGFSKYVSVKYTFNRWVNTYECEAQHRRHSADFRNIDQFEFHVDVPADVDRVDFVLRYCVNGQEYWDNNDGQNYTLETESAYTPPTMISLPHDCDFNDMRFY